MAERKTKISVVLPTAEYERYEAYCAEKGYKKSTLIARLVRDHLDEASFQLQRRLPISSKDDGGTQQ
jgi:hypothetical protein